jgi:cell wall-associated NlpC family hydrolase
MGALLHVVNEGETFAKIADGSFVPARHIRSCNQDTPDFVAVAEKFMGVPYVWGGKTWRGIDCSGLVQLALQSAGYECPRDSDMQADEVGSAVMPRSQSREEFKRGDIVFWKGHVGLMLDDAHLLHANAYHMAVAREPLAEAAERIAKAGLPITVVKRIGDRSE